MGLYWHLCFDSGIVSLCGKNDHDLFEDAHSLVAVFLQKSTHEWLYAVGDDLSDIIGQKNKTDIKNHLQLIVEHYPDFR